MNVYLMKKVILMTVIAVMTMFQVLGFQCSSISPLAEDSNGNALPDLIELQKGTFVLHIVYPMTIYATVIAITIIFTVTLIIIKVTIHESVEYRNDFDSFAKIFKSKMRGW